MVLMNLSARQQWKSRHREQAHGQRQEIGRRGCDERGEQHGNIHTNMCK